MAKTVFIPQLWAARFLANLRNVAVFQSLCNRDYEGEISRMGDTVNVQRPAALAVRPYTGADITVDDVDGSSVALVIDQANYFAFRVDDVFRAQAQPGLIDAFMAEAAAAETDTVDVYLAAIMAASAGITVNTNLVPGEVNSASIYDALVDLGTTASNNKIPKTGRWIVLPPSMTGLLAKADVIQRAEASVVTSGYLGRCAGWEIHESPNVPVDEGVHTVLAGWGSAGMTFADQVVETETCREEKRFSSLVKGLHVFGSKLVRPETCMRAYLKVVAEA